MRLLLDTHVLLWALADEDALSAAARAALCAPDAEIFVSMATLWEIAIKHARNRGRADDMPVGAATVVAEIDAAGFALLAIKPRHVFALGELPQYHRDPFDRMLVAQARSEPMTLLTQDRALAAYGDHVTLV